jgi:LacI family transcriptional regulator
VTQRRATRVDVAKLAQTSVAVVSYVINDGPRGVSPERRRRVLDAMRELRYQPNAIARSLTSTRTNTIGMIVPNISNAFFAELALAVEDAAIAAGRLLFLGNSNEEREREQAYVDSFLQQRADAVIIVGVARDASVQQLLDADVPVVVLDRPLSTGDAVNVGIDHEEAAFLGTQHLLEHGHRRIGCLTGPEGLLVAQDRLEGWTRAMRSAGLDTEQHIYRSPFSLDGGRDVARQVFDRSPGLTALFVASDEQARGVIAAATEAGVSIPDRLAIVSVDGTRQSDFSSPPLTTMRQPFAELGAAAVATALDAAKGSPVLHATLRVSRSCGCNRTKPQAR